MLRPLLQLVCVALCLCHSRTERTVNPPYPLSFRIDQVAGSAWSNGPVKSSNGTPGNFYTTLVIHDNLLYIGGKSELFTARLDDLTTINNVSIPPTKRPTFLRNGVCKSCDGNYIRIIQPLNDSVILECGTNANNPYCRQRSSSDLAPLESHVETNVAPSVHNQNSSWLLLNSSDSTYEIFSGTYLVNSLGYLKKAAITKAILVTEARRTDINIQLKTKLNPHQVMNEPQFAGKPIRYNGRIFFFYREFATEYINAGRVIVSRVATICENDQGGKAFFKYRKDQLVTFAKARLNCSIPGRYPYHYNEIQDVYQSTVDERVVFAVFSTGPNGIASSAVCAYRLDAIEELFRESPFRSKKLNGELWTRLNLENTIKKRPITCPVTTNYNETEYQTIFKDLQLLDESTIHRLHYDRGQPDWNSSPPDRHPLLVTHGERFTRIVVDERVHKSTDVMFLGTENSTVLKAYLNVDRSEARIVEEISLTMEDMKSPVLSMVRGEEGVYAGTDSGVFKVPLQHCQDYRTCHACLDARDPYCSWYEGECRASSVGMQDLKNGSSHLCTEKTSEGIIIHRSPLDQLRSSRLANQSVQMYLMAEAAVASRLRLEEVRCGLCGHLRFSQYTTSCSGRQLLVAVIDGSSPLASFDCPCTWDLRGHGGLETSGQFDLLHDDSELVTSDDDMVDELWEFDLNIQKYKYELKAWKIAMARSNAEDQDLLECPLDICS